MRDAATWTRVRRPEIHADDRVDSSSGKRTRQAGQGYRRPVRHRHAGARREGDPRQTTLYFTADRRDRRRSCCPTCPPTRRARCRCCCRSASPPTPTSSTIRGSDRARCGDAINKRVPAPATGAFGARRSPPLSRERDRLRDALLRRHRARLQGRHPVRDSRTVSEARTDRSPPRTSGARSPRGRGDCAASWTISRRSPRSTRSASRCSVRRASARRCCGRARPIRASP